MASRLESLPPELLNLILSHLPVLEISRLQQASRRLHKFLDSYISSAPNAADILMRWGCVNGEPWAIDKALSYGADASLIHVAQPGSSYKDKKTSLVRLSTLCLAARRRHYGVFQLLIDRGAGLNVAGSRQAPLRWHLFDPQHPGLLQQCLDEGLKDQIRQYQPGVDEALLLAVKQDLDPKIIQAWLDLGANPVALVGSSKWDPESALSAAVLSGSITLIKLLLAKSPDHDIPPARLPYTHSAVTSYSRPAHPWKALPLLAAAHRMATHRDKEPMEALLEAGGDINMGIDHHLLGFPGLALSCLPQKVTPLLAYLLLIDFEAENGDNLWKPSHGVKLFLDWGAKIQNEVCDIEQQHLHPVPFLSLLWEKWQGTKSLIHDEGFAILELLLRHGAAKGIVAHIILLSGRLHNAPGTGPLAAESYTIAVQRWHSLLDLLLIEGNFNSALSDELSDILYEFLLRIFSTLQPEAKPPNPCSKNGLHQYFDESHPVTVQKLIEKGADIRYRSRRSKNSGMTILSCIATGDTTNRHRTGSSGQASPLQLSRQRSFVSMLAKLGAEVPEMAYESSEDPMYQK